MKSRFDRFLISEEWEDFFNGSIQSLLPGPTSDHHPILLDGGGMRRGPTPFRSENMWLKEEGLLSILQDSWEGWSFQGSASFILTQTLNALKPMLKFWNREVFGNVEQKKKGALNCIAAWNEVENNRSLTMSKLGEREEARGEYRKWVLLEEIS